MMTVKCGRCKNRLFDFYGGRVEISIKCNRCKRVLRFKNCDSDVYISQKIKKELYMYEAFI